MYTTAQLHRGPKFFRASPGYTARYSASFQHVPSRVVFVRQRDSRARQFTDSLDRRQPRAPQAISDRIELPPLFIVQRVSFRVFIVPLVQCPIAFDLAV
jgi:hypothetical protein